MVVIIGHYYMTQFLLAVIISNLTKIQNKEAYSLIKSKRELVENDKKETEEEDVKK
jgi:hypothetical protein